jgi:hypothetical protein
VLLVLALLVGGGLYLVSQPAGGVQPVAASSAAVLTAEAKIFKAFATAAAEAVLGRRPVQATVQLTDAELTSLAASRLAQSSSSVSDVILNGTPGAFKTTADVAWNGWTFHVYARGNVSFGADNSLHVAVQEADVGRLPVPSSVVEAIVAQNVSASGLSVPPGVSALSLQPVSGGAVLSGTVSPDVQAPLL